MKRVKITDLVSHLLWLPFFRLNRARAIRYARMNERMHNDERAYACWSEAAHWLRRYNHHLQLWLDAMDRLLTVKGEFQETEAMPKSPVIAEVTVLPEGKHDHTFGDRGAIVQHVAIKDAGNGRSWWICEDPIVEDLWFYGLQVEGGAA